MRRRGEHRVVDVLAGTVGGEQRGQPALACGACCPVASARFLLPVTVPRSLCDRQAYLDFKLVMGVVPACFPLTLNRWEPLREGFRVRALCKVSPAQPACDAAVPMNAVST